MEQQRKIGEGALAAYGRQGLAELRAALYPEFNIAQPTDYGMVGKSTPGEVAESRREDSTLADRLKQIEAGKDDPGPQEPERGIDRD